MRKVWTERETLQALALYLQTPYHDINAKNPSIICLAKSLNRSDSSVTMKMLNFAALNPLAATAGHKGLPHGSKLDKYIWENYSQSWPELEELSYGLVQQDDEGSTVTLERYSETYLSDSTKETTVPGLIKQRRGQGFFRRMVLANYQSKCCITGIQEPRLIVASHIVPWREDEANRLNPHNGLALSATFDRAFDQGLLTISGNLEIKVSKQLLQHQDDTTREFFKPFHRKPIIEPERFLPDAKFIKWHNAYFETQSK